MFCENCGAKLPEDSQFCDQCGARLEDIEAEQPLSSAPSVRSMNHSRPAVRTASEPQEDYDDSIADTMDYGDNTQAKRSESKVGWITLVVFAAVAVVVILAVTGAFGKDKPTGEGGSTIPTISSPVSGGDVSTADSTEGETTAAPDTDTTTTTTTTAPPASLSTTVVPTRADFDWFTSKANSWVYGIVPSDSRSLYGMDAVGGSWKGLYYALDEAGEASLLYFTMTFEGIDGNVNATLDWHNAEWAGGDAEPLDTWVDETLRGSFGYSSLELGMPGSSIDMLFYEIDGKQYAEGLWTVESGEELRIALVRP